MYIKRAESLEVLGVGPFKDKAVLIRMDPEALVQVNFDSIAVQVAFGEGTPLMGVPILESLWGLVRHTWDEVLQPLWLP